MFVAERASEIECNVLEVRGVFALFMGFNSLATFHA